MFRQLLPVCEWRRRRGQRADEHALYRLAREGAADELLLRELVVVVVVGARHDVVDEGAWRHPLLRRHVTSVQLVDRLPGQSSTNIQQRRQVGLRCVHVGACRDYVGRITTTARLITSVVIDMSSRHQRQNKIQSCRSLFQWTSWIHVGNNKPLSTTSLHSLVF